MGVFAPNVYCYLIVKLHVAENDSYVKLSCFGSATASIWRTESLFGG